MSLKSRQHIQIIALDVLPCSQSQYLDVLPGFQRLNLDIASFSKTQCGYCLVFKDTIWILPHFQRHNVDVLPRFERQDLDALPHFERHDLDVLPRFQRQVFLKFGTF